MAYREGMSRRAAGEAQARSKARASARPSAVRGSDGLLRREGCERENARAAGSAGDCMISDSAQLPAISTATSASSRASLLQEVHTVHQEPVSDRKR